MIAVTARFQAKRGKEAELEALLRSFVPRTSEEPEVLAYALHTVSGQPRTFFFYERHASQQSFEAHLARPYLQEALARFPELLDAPAVLEIMEILDEKD